MEFRILDMIQKFRTPLLDSLMCMITKLGDAGAVWIFLTVILLLIPKTRKCGTVIMAALAIDFVFCNGILKPFIGRILVGIFSGYIGCLIIAKIKQIRNKRKEMPLCRW